MTFEELKKKFPALVKEMENKIKEDYKDELKQREDHIITLKEKIKETPKSVDNTSEVAALQESVDKLSSTVVELSDKNKELTESILEKEASDKLQSEVITKLKEHKGKLHSLSFDKLIDDLVAVGTENTKESAEKSNWDVVIDGYYAYETELKKTVESADVATTNSQRADGTTPAKESVKAKPSAAVNSKLAKNIKSLF